MSFEKIYSKQRLKREVERVEAKNSLRLAEGKNDEYWTHVSGHNPITNPIGASVPKVLPGQRLGRGFRADQKDNFTVKDLFSAAN